MSSLPAKTEYFASSLVKTLSKGSFLWACLAGVGLYLVYVLFVLGGTQYAHFSLIDDGQSVHNLHILKNCLISQECEEVMPVLVEKEFGRFRPAYWILQSLVFEINGVDPTNIHLFRIIVLGGILCLLLCLSIFSISRSFFGSIIGVGILIGNFSYTENIVRIGPGEPFQLLFLSLFSLLFLNYQKMTRTVKPSVVVVSLVVLILAMSLIKETTLALLPVLFLCWMFGRSYLPRWGWLALALPFTAIFLGKVAATPDSSSTDYGGFYAISIQGIIRNAIAYFYIVWGVLKWYIPGLAILLVLLGTKRLAGKYDWRAIGYWLSVTIFFGAVLLPWEFVLERYLLIVIFAFAVLIGSVYGILYTELLIFVQKKLPFPSILSCVCGILAIFIVSNVFFFSTSLHLARSRNYATWYAGYLEYEYTLVEAIAETPGLVILNATDSLDNWEVLYEIPLHLHYFYGQTDKVTHLPDSLVVGDVVMNTSSLSPNLLISDKVSSQSSQFRTFTQEIPQIDLVKYRLQFRHRPLQTWANPPLSNEKITHYWELREITGP